MKDGNSLKAKALLISVWLITTLAVAHTDDPKLRDRVPPYSGPGFRAALHKKAPSNFPQKDVELLSWLPVHEFGDQQTIANDCWGYTSPSGREYAIMGLSHGTAFIEITNPENPVIVDIKDGSPSIWRDVKVYQSYAYSINQSAGGIQVFDLSAIDEGRILAKSSVLSGGVLATHNVAINEDSGYLYRCGGSDSTGIRVYNLANPARPVLVGRWNGRYVHDAQIVNYTEGPYAGKEIAFCAAGFNGGNVQTGLTILDVTDKTRIVQLAHLVYPNGSYSHQGWLSPDKKYFYLGDELDEITRGGVVTTHVIDVTDLSKPVEAGVFTNGLHHSDHNLYVRDNLIFKADYRGGLRIFDTTQSQVNPVEIAHFDTYPDDDASNLNGLWSVYPFFKSNVVIGSDLERGLFVWKVKALQADIQTRLLFPWISNSGQFESAIHLANYGEGEARVTLTARRGNGEVAVGETQTIPSRGFIEIKASELFATLGIGDGYSVVLESESTTVTARWVTYDKGEFSPSQGVAVPLPTEDSENGNIGKHIALGALSGNEAFSSAPVVVNASSTPADITIYYFDQAGTLVQTDVLQNVQPYTPATPRIVDLELGNLHAVAVSSANITGAVFVFNGLGQTAIGNATTIEDFIVP